ncbi:hypothetical protein L5G32_13700 [Gordonia sp. HY002]|nr:hypothetical protein [Gordonia zhenghanii]
MRTDDAAADDPLVTLEFYDGPPRQTARELIAAARAVDEEMSFASQRGRRTAPATSTVEVRTGLHRWSLPAADRSRLAGVMTDRPGSSARVLDVVIAPEYRSTGVATAAIERTRIEGWFAAPGVSDFVVACAYGSHPAALRLARRFGAITVGERHHMVLPAMSAYRAPTADTSHDSASVSGDRWGALAERVVDDVVDGTGSIDLACGGPAVHTPATIHDAVTRLFAAGATSIEAAVDGRDDELIDLLRSAAFGHDRTDVLIQFDPRITP